GPTPIWCPCRWPRQARHMQVALITDLGAITEECARVAESLGVMLTVLPADSGGWQSASVVLLGEGVREARVPDSAARRRAVLGAITEECARVAESLGVMLTVLPPDTGGWQSASLILLGEDVREAPVTDRADRILVVLDGDEPGSTWAKAAQLGVDQLAVLPAAAEWLSGRMIAAIEPPVAPGTTVGVVAGCGGAGASVLACALARRAGADHSTVLVDADPLGGGLDLVLGAEQVPGPRWTDLSASRGQLRPSTLAD